MFLRFSTSLAVILRLFGNCLHYFHTFCTCFEASCAQVGLKLGHLGVRLGSSLHLKVYQSHLEANRGSLRRSSGDLAAIMSSSSSQLAVLRPSWSRLGVILGVLSVEALSWVPRRAGPERGERNDKPEAGRCRKTALKNPLFQWACLVFFFIL